MKISVKVKDIEILVDDQDSNSIIKCEPYNRELQKTITLICQEAMKLLKERQF
jgi:hypothetical protein